MRLNYKNGRIHIYLLNALIHHSLGCDFPPVHLKAFFSRSLVVFQMFMYLLVPPNLKIILTQNDERESYSKKFQSL